MPALSSAAPRPYRRPSRSAGSNGSLSQAAASPGGCTSWCAYSRTVGAPGGPGRCPSTAGWLPPAVTTSTSGSPAARSSAATSRALAARCGAAAGSADTDGIRTSRSRSPRTEGSTCATAAESQSRSGPSESISRTLPGWQRYQDQWTQACAAGVVPVLTMVLHRWPGWAARAAGGAGARRPAARGWLPSAGAGDDQGGAAGLGDLAGRLEALSAHGVGAAPAVLEDRVG